MLGKLGAQAIEKLASSQCPLNFSKSVSFCHAYCLCTLSFHNCYTLSYDFSCSATFNTIT